MPFSSPAMMIGAANNSENDDRVNFVTLSFSLHSIPANVFFLGQNRKVGGYNWWCQGQPALA
jgi:hypothetical protein